MSNNTILIPHNIGANVYLRELAQAYERLGANVVLGLDNFLYLNCHPEIVHIQWPEQLYRVALLHKGSEVKHAKIALERLRYLKKQGARCVLTVHNMIPHENSESEASKLIYQGCFKESDFILHHCKKSVELIKKKYELVEAKKNIVFPHGHYFCYPSEMSKKEAREILGLSDKDFVFLHFGIIRGYKGLQRVLKSLFKSKIKNKKLVIAGWPLNFEQSTTNIVQTVKKWLWTKQGRIVWHLRKIPNDEVQIFFKACDVVVLGHHSGLNSGVAILGMTYGRVVVGPNLGCIGEVLSLGENVIYDPKRLEG